MDLLAGSTVYLSGPMDFVASREEESRNGWRSRLTQVLEGFGVRVFDPWHKPLVLSLGRYGIEDETTPQARASWRFDEGPDGAEARASVAKQFWPVMHIDLRMVDLSDFVIACCPTNLYSVGTPHEIVVARQQRKPVLLVSPPVRYPIWEGLESRYADDPRTTKLLVDVGKEVVIRANATGTPSSWYTSLVDSESFFDGFGWDAVRSRFGWADSYLDEREAPPNPPVRPLIQFLASMQRGARPQRWDRDLKAFVDNDDWLLLERRSGDQAATDGGTP